MALNRQERDYQRQIGSAIVSMLQAHLAEMKNELTLEHRHTQEQIERLTVKVEEGRSLWSRVSGWLKREWKGA